MTDIEIQPRKQDVEDFLTHTTLARYLSERCRRYVNNDQWTREEVHKLQLRGQAAITNNRCKPKVESFKGLIEQNKTDPKAYPRTQMHEQAAEVITDGLRFVSDNVDLHQDKMDVADNIFVEGYGGAITDFVVKKDKQVEITVDHIPWDRIFFDPYSRRKDFSDARYMGIVLWMDKAEALEKFPKKEEAIDEALNAHFDFDETFEDRPRWVDGSGDRKRIRIAQEFFKDKGQWHLCYFTGEGFLMEPELSPYQDEEGEPTNPIELQHAYIDADNDRFGEVVYWLDMQDEINHRRSKYLYMLSERQTYGNNKSIPKGGIEEVKRELAKARGHVQMEDGVFGQDFGIIQNADMGLAQFQLLEEAKREFDATSSNPSLSLERQTGDVSGVAFQKLQNAALLELASLFGCITAWEKRIYRQIYWRMKQFWTKEKWIRVTDDQKKLRWVGMNVPITAQERLEEVINDESEDPFVRQVAARNYMQLMQTQDPRLQELVEVRNPLPELMMDIKLEQSIDTVNVQQEQFKELVLLAQGRPEVPFTTLLKLSSLNSDVKDEVIDEIEQQREAALNAQGQASQLQAENVQADTELKISKATESQQKSIQTNLENQLLTQQPAEITSVAV